MVVRDEDSGARVRFAEGDGPLWSSFEAASAPAPRDWRSAYELERARADAAEARCEELRMAELRARTDAGSWKSRFKSYRSKLDGAGEETKELRREIKAGAPGLHREMARLCKALSRALAKPLATAIRARERRLGALEPENRTPQGRAGSGGPQEDDRLAERRDYPAGCGASAIARPEGDGQVAVRGERGAALPTGTWRRQMG